MDNPVGLAGHRKIDPTAHTLGIELVRAVAGLTPAFCLAWWLSGTAGWRHGAVGFVLSTTVFVLAGLAALFATSGRPIQQALIAQRAAIARQEEQLQATADGHQFTADLQAALEMADDEPGAVRTIALALRSAVPGPAELLLADSSRAHLHRAAVAQDPPGCDVATPWGCPAVRRSRTLEFSDNQALATCPHLRDRPEESSALCVPVTILGTPMGVLHVVGPPRQHVDPVTRAKVEAVAAQGGTRIGMLRAISSSQLAATTDPLTGQLNRRSLEEELRRLDIEHHPYAIAFADLDHFKRLNDTYGHATGDQALRNFATVAAATVRTGDLVCRYGGEEFLLVYVGCTVADAAPVVHRMRQSLAESIAGAGLPAYTVSVGLADSTYSPIASEVIAMADSALLMAKREGRDQLLIATRPTPDTPTDAGVPIVA